MKKPSKRIAAIKSAITARESESYWKGFVAAREIIEDMARDEGSDRTQFAIASTGGYFTRSPDVSSRDSSAANTLNRAALRLVKIELARRYGR